MDEVKPEDVKPVEAPVVAPEAPKVEAPVAPVVAPEAPKVDEPKPEPKRERNDDCADEGDDVADEPWGPKDVWPDTVPSPQ